MKYQKTQYCIVENGEILENTIRWGKTLCIEDFIEKSWIFSIWKDAYNLGTRCVKINITIEEYKK